DMLRPDPSAGPEALAAWNARRTQDIFDRIDRYQREHGIQPAQAAPAPAPEPDPPREPPTVAAEVLRNDDADASTPSPDAPAPALGSSPQADEPAPAPPIDSADPASRGEEKPEADQSSLHASA